MLIQERCVSRGFHAVTALVTWVALILQLSLVFLGHGVLVADNPPSLAIRVGRFFSYFTIQSNILVAVAASWLALHLQADTRGFRAIRLAGLIGITVTGVVYFFLLRPLVNLSGWSAVADNLLHVAVPLLAIIGWFAFGPRGRVDRTAIRDAFVWPVLWLAWTFFIGATTGWFPYPFLNWHTHGAGSVVVVSVGIFAFALALFAAAAWADSRLPADLADPDAWDSSA